MHLGCKSFPNCKIPDIPFWKDRGASAENEANNFISHNILRFGKGDKHDAAFLFVIGGSGYGKTWFGRKVAHITADKYGAPLYVYIDFSKNGNAWNDQIDFDASVGLGFRIAAQLFFSCSASELLKNTVVANHVKLFDFTDGTLYFGLYISYGLFITVMEHTKSYVCYTTGRDARQANLCTSHFA